MPTCRHCDADHDPEDLVRHERGAVVVVHCPDCQGPLGSWRDPARRRDER